MLNGTRKLLPYTLSLIILLEGFTSIATEILTIRQLLPVAGGNVIVTSLIIAIFLMFLALGYERGGKVFQGAAQTLCLNFLIAALWLSIGLSYLFIDFFFYFCQHLFNLNIVYPLLAYLLFVIAPLIYLLGQTVPIAMNLVDKNRPAGFIGGKTMSLSTIGSFFGATLTTLICMRYLGVAYTVILNVFTLLCLVIILSDKKTIFKHLFLCTIIFSMAILINIIPERKLFVSTNNYANYQIITPNALAQDKILVINNAFSSYLDKTQHGFPYIELIKKILFTDLNLQHAEILILGAGGFSISAAGDFTNHFTYVDIDANIKKIATHYFIPHVNGDFIADDARHFLKYSTKQFAVIVSDTFSDLKAIPAHLISMEYLKTLRARLSENGVAVFNIIANPTLSDAYSKHVDNTIRAAFGNCMAIPLNYHNQATNIIYVCHKLNTDHDKLVYVDNLNNSTTDAFMW